MTLDEWIDIVCDEFHLERPDVTAALDLAREVAHRVARPAAPITALLVGLASQTTSDVAAVTERVLGLLPPEA